MEIHFTPEVEKTLNDIAAQGGRGNADELVQEVMVGYVEELRETREVLNSRYDDLKSGRVRPIPAEAVEAHFRERSAAARRLKSGS